MNTALTVAAARALLQRYSTAADFLSDLNQAVSRIMYSGKWKGMVIRVAINTATSQGFITLPVEFLSALGAAYNHWPTRIFGEFHVYSLSGPGTPRDTNQWYGQLQDLGDGYCSQEDIIQQNDDVTPHVQAVPGAIVLYSTGSDNGKTVRIFGEEQETGQPVSDSSGNPGEQLTLNAPFVVSTKHYSKLTDCVKGQTNGPVQAWVAPTAGGPQYQIASWLPWQEVPRYRRYQTGRIEKVIQILCQRRFIPMRAETDLVPIDSLAALKNTIRSIRYEDTGYDEKAANAWEKALGFVNDEATASRGGAEPSLPISTWGDAPIPPQW